MIKIVAFLQNQWFQDPDRVRKILARNDGDEFRRLWIRKTLFYRSLSGRRLRDTFGDLCDKIVWEEVSREIGGVSNSVFAPDRPHMENVVRDAQPDLVVAFGQAAQAAVIAFKIHEGRRLFCCHPAARGGLTKSMLKQTANWIRQHRDGFVTGPMPKPVYLT